jgi:hypothetical protein
MIAMDESLKRLVSDDVIEARDALEMALDKDSMGAWLARHGKSVDDAEDDF